MRTSCSLGMSPDGFGSIKIVKGSVGKLGSKTVSAMQEWEFDPLPLTGGKHLELNGLNQIYIFRERKRESLESERTPGKKKKKKNRF